ncbi:MAG: restriction endonuclease subunit S [Nitrospira sp.]|nr:restriction endonuclease subunit S [Nitrospira sp.]
MQASIKEITLLSMGINFRSHHEAAGSDGLCVVQMKDLDNTSVKIETLEKFALKPPRNVTFLRPGDIIFRSRGRTTTAVIVPRNIGKAVLSAPLFLVRVKETSRVLPGYLCWYINQTPAQRFLYQRTEGSALKMISLKHLSDLEIPLPALEVQSKIEKIAAMLTKEAVLLEEIKRTREKYVERLLMRAAS